MAGKRNKWITKQVGGFLGGGVRESLSGWEDAYYGGYHNVLWDFPDIKIPFELDWNLEGMSMGSMSWYEYNKLIKIFLLKVNVHHLKQMFVEDSKVEEVQKWLKKTKRTVINPKSVEKVLQNVINKESELQNLFDHYQAHIKHTKFFFDHKEKDEEGEGQGGKGDSKDQQQDSREAAKARMQMMNQLMEALDDIKEKKYQYGGGAGDLNNMTSVFRQMKPGKTTVYSDQEMLMANQLYNILDVSFDPQSDKIHSLRSGKLDVKKICEVPAGNTSVYSRVEENQLTRPFSVCILMDESGSMGHKLYHQMSMVKVLYKTFSAMLPPDKMFIYGYSDGGRGAADIRVYHDKYNHTFEETIERMPENGHGGTPENAAVAGVYKKVRDFTDDNVIFLYTCDGGPDGGHAAMELMKKQVEKCKRDGFVTIGIGIETSSVNYYKYNTIVHDPSELVKKASRIINHVVKTEFQS